MDSNEPHHAWHVINYIAAAPRRSDMIRRAVDDYNRRHPADDGRPALDLFAPTFVEAVKRDGAVRLVERPLTFHYIFLRGDLRHLKDFCTTVPGCSFVLSHLGVTSGRYLTVSDAEMASFRIIARAYGNRLPYLPAAEAGLVKGDEVEVVSGPFAGLRGTFMSRRGTSDGHVVIAVDQALATIAYDIKSDNIRILRFSPDSRRAYDQLDAYLPRLLAAYSRSQSEPLEQSEQSDIRSNSNNSNSSTSSHNSNSSSSSTNSNRLLPPELLAPIITFVRRFGRTETTHLKIDAKLQALLLASATLLGDEETGRRASDRLARALPGVTNPATLALIHLLRAYADSPADPTLSPHLTAGRTLLPRLTPAPGASTSAARRILLTAYSRL